MTRPLTELQQEFLRSLHRGWRFGGDRRTEIGLEKRGLVVARWFVMRDGKHWLLPDLTLSGRAIAARLVAEQLVAVGARQTHRGLLVIDGGIAA